MMKITQGNFVILLIKPLLGSSEQSTKTKLKVEVEYQARPSFV